MQLPNVVHPTIFTVNGHKLQVVAYCAMTDAQALKATLHAVRSHKLPKKPNPKAVIRLVTLFDQESLGLLGE